MNKKEWHEQRRIARTLVRMDPVLPKDVRMEQIRIMVDLITKRWGHEMIATMGMQHTYVWNKPGSNPFAVKLNMRLHPAVCETRRLSCTQ